MRTEQKKIRVVYVAGKFTADTRAGVEANIRAAELVAIEVARLGLMPLCLHANTAHPGFELAQPYQFWIEGTLELLRRCDAIVMVPGWEQSRGACGEIAEAHRIGLPVFVTMAELQASMQGKSSPFSEPPRDTDPCEPMDDVVPFIPDLTPPKAPAIDEERMTGAERHG